MVTINLEDDTSMMQVDDNFVPFTIPERISQLGEIDKNIVKLMEHTSSALSALGYTPPSLSDPPTITPTQQLATQRVAFATSMDSLLSTLHTVDIALKRQIMGLKEANIIVLGDASAAKEASLSPNGVGAVGKLDAAWLNSRSDKVESDMEVELWAEAKKFVEALAEEKGAEVKVEGNSGGGDVGYSDR